MDINVALGVAKGQLDKHKTLWHDVGSNHIMPKGRGNVKTISELHDANKRNIIFGIIANDPTVRWDNPTSVKMTTIDSNPVPRASMDILLDEAIDLRDCSITLKYYIEEPEKMHQVTVYLSRPGVIADQESVYAVQRYYDGSAVQGWVIKSYAGGDFGYSGGASDDTLSTINKIRITVTSMPGQYASVYIGSITIQKRSATRGKVLFRFDDAVETVFTNALPKLAKYGFPADTYVITGRVGTPGHMTTDQLKHLRDIGWYIGSHSHSHQDLTLLTPEQIHKDLWLSRDWLISNGFDGRAFAYPHSSHNAQTKEIVAKYYNTAFLAYGNFISENQSDPYRLETFWPTKIGADCVTEIKLTLDKVKKYNRTMVLGLHSINQGISLYDNMTPAQFEEVVDYIKALDLDVITASDILNKYQERTVAYVGGHILTDKSTGQLYKLVVNNGSLGVELM